MKNIIVLLLIILVSSCSLFRGKSSSLLEVDKIYIDKSNREMLLLDELGGEIKKYKIRLGFNPLGPKLMEGDGKTPEGNYKILYHKPNSQYYKSLKISYPNETDKRIAYSLGVSPGGEIMIHGLENNSGVRGYWNHLKYDWTAGCIAVKNNEIDEIYDLVKDGTEVEIVP
jgi:murein L,D-transpeptidase YafK